LRSGAAIPRSAAEAGRQGPPSFQDGKMAAAEAAEGGSNSLQNPPFPSGTLGYNKELRFA